MVAGISIVRANGVLTQIFQMMLSASPAMTTPMAIRTLVWGSARPGTRSRLMAVFSSAPSSGGVKCFEALSHRSFTRRFRTKAANWRWPTVRSCTRKALMPRFMFQRLQQQVIQPSLCMT